MGANLQRPWGRKFGTGGLLPAVLAIVLFAVLATGWLVRRADSSLRRDLLVRAQTVAAINSERICALTSTGADLASPDYLRLKQQLAAIRNANPEFRYAYLLGRRPDGMVTLLVDDVPMDSEELDPPGLPYPEASPELRGVFDSGLPAVEGPVADRWGTWVSALVPVAPADSGRCPAVFGVDVDARDWNLKVATRAAPAAVSLWFLLALSGFSIILWRTNSLIRRQRAALAESEQRLLFALETSNTGAWDLNLRDQTANRSAEHDRIFGYPSPLPQWTYGRFLEHVVPEDRPEVERRFQLAVGTATDWSFECRIRRADGQIRWIWAAGRHKPAVPGADPRIAGIVQDITERIERDREYQTLFREMLDGFARHEIICDQERRPVDYRFLAVNPAFEQMTGLKADDIIGRTVLEVLPGTEKLWIDRYGHVALTGEPAHFEQYSSELGRHFAVAAFRPAPHQFATIVADITEQTKAREQLRETAALLRMAERMARLGGWCVDLVDNRLIWSDEVAAIHEMPQGYSPTIQEGIDFYAPEWRERITEVFNRCVSDGVGYDEEMQILTRSGRRVWVRTMAEAVRDEKGAVTRIEGTFQDITDRKQAEAALRESELLLSQAQAIAHVGGWMLDHATGVLRWTGETYRIFGLPEGTAPLTSRDFAAAVHPDDRAHVAEAFLSSMKAGADSYEIEHRIVLPDGRIRNLVERCLHVWDSSGEVIRSVGIVQDITDRKLAEEEEAALREQLAQAQKMESIGRLAGGVAHDYNNMLGVILGHAELALENLEPGDLLHADLEEIRTAARRSADLTRQLLAFARKQTIAPKVLDLNDTVTGMISMLQRLIGEDIDLCWSPGPDLWPVRMDPTQLNQVLANLCVNSRDAISGVGRIEIETRNTIVDEDSPDEGTLPPGEYVLLSVSDTGCGMDEETLAHLFEPFFTTKEQGRGTGLGLATVHGAIVQNGGHVSVTSHPGAGTTFRIHLPRHHAPVARDHGPSTHQVPEGGTGTILLVEDEPSILRMTSLMLERLGYTVLAAGTPAQALDIARKHPEPIDVLLTDVVMPSMNGRELASAVLASRPGTRCLFTSGYTADHIATRGVLDRGIDFLQKPFTLKSLDAAIRSLMESHPTGP